MTKTQPISNRVSTENKTVVRKWFGIFRLNQGAKIRVDGRER